MFSPSLLRLTILLAALARVTLATHSLALSVRGPTSVDGVANMKVVATVRNTGDEHIVLLRDPNSALAPHWDTRSITVGKFAEGAPPKFQGVRVKWSPTEAISTRDVIELAPGEARDFTHDLSKRFDFTPGGEGTYTVRARDLFTRIDDAGNMHSIRAVHDEPHSLALRGVLVDVPQERRSFRFGKRATFVGCSAAQQSAVTTAVPQAATYAANASKYLGTLKAASARYTQWFGALTNARFALVSQHFSLIAANKFDSFTYDCTCAPVAGLNSSTTFAYVQPNLFGTINLCGLFWVAPTTGTDSQAGTIVHESSHFTANGGTDDFTYGQAGAGQLAVTNPDQAVMNADSHEYFAENNPALA